MDSQVGINGVPVIVRGNVILNAGVEGLGLYGIPGLLSAVNFNQAPGYAKGIIEYNYIENSNTLQVDRNWEAGVGKILYTAGSIIS